MPKAKSKYFFLFAFTLSSTWCFGSGYMPVYQKYVPGLHPYEPSVRPGVTHGNRKESIDDKLARLRLEYHRYEIKQQLKKRSKNQNELSGNSFNGCSCSFRYSGLVQTKKSEKAVHPIYHLLETEQNSSSSLATSTQSKKFMVNKGKGKNSTEAFTGPPSWRKQGPKHCELYHQGSQAHETLVRKRLQFKESLDQSLYSDLIDYKPNTLLSACLNRIAQEPDIYLNVIGDLPSNMLATVYYASSVYSPLGYEDAKSLLGTWDSGDGSYHSIDTKVNNNVDQDSRDSDESESWEAIYSDNKDHEPLPPSISNTINANISYSALSITTLDLTFSSVNAPQLRSLLLNKNQACQFSNLKTLILAHTPNLPFPLSFHSWGITPNVPIQKLSLADKSPPEQSVLQFLNDLSNATPKLRLLDLSYNQAWINIDNFLDFKHWNDRWFFLSTIVIQSIHKGVYPWLSHVNNPLLDLSPQEIADAEYSLLRLRGWGNIKIL